MDQSEKAARINISLYPSLWHAFRMACLARHLAASQEIRRLIEHQLAVWHAEKKETEDV